ncbi:hypothetical protein LguiA_031944 [Lonicera macranthoides]
MANQRETGASMSIFMLPWLAHGHINPFLELAKQLTQRNFLIYFCSTPINLTPIKNQISDFNISNNNANNIQLVELHLPSLPDLPPHFHTTNGLPKHLGPTLGKALDMAEPDLTLIIRNLNPSLVIFDVTMQWVGQLASSLNIPSSQLITSCAATYSFFSHIIANGGTDGFPFKDIYLRDFEMAALMQLAQTGSPGGGSGREDGTHKYPKNFESNIILVKTFREIEGEIIDYLSLLSKKKVMSVGPLIRDFVHEEKREDIIEWLNGKKPGSTVLVSFGSECYLSKDEIKEIARGLELSGVNFLWVVRFSTGEKLKMVDVLPDGFLEKVKERGLIVEGWAPQVRILSHASVGGFLSHCGWNSILESLKFGVPIIGLPMNNFDQPLGGRVLVAARVSVEVMRDKNGKIAGEEVWKAIKQVMGTEKIGEDVRKKAREFMEKLKLNGKDEIDVAVEELLQLCGKH